MADQQITPVTAEDEEQSQRRLTIDPQVSAPDGSFYVFDGVTGYRQVVEAWSVESHIPPTNRTERFGSVEAWAAYVGEYAMPDGAHLLTWSESGLKAILDYLGPNGEPGRCTWQAEHPFVQTVQWRRWTELANGRARGQQELLEALEDYAEDVVEPSAGEIATLLRTMRGTVNSSATSTLNEDGSYAVEWQKSATVRAGKDGRATLPNEIRVAVPVFKGHTEAGPDGKQVPVRFALKVRIRVNPDSDGRLLFRLSMPDREAALEAALENRVQAAHDALGAGYDVLRATS